MEKEEIKKIVEVLLFVSDKPLAKEKIFTILDKAERKQVLEAIDEMRNEYETRQGPLQIVPLAGGYQLCTRPEYGPWIKKLYKSQTTMRLSPSALEILSIIAYKQPITRGGINRIRGVDGSHALNTLLKKKLVKIAGRADSLGRPALYGTTDEFLRYFGLESLSDIPKWEEITVEKESTIEESGQEEGSEA